MARSSKRSAEKPLPVEVQNAQAAGDSAASDPSAADSAARPLDVEALTLDELLDEVESDPLAETVDGVHPVYDDDFIRARRAANAARAGYAGGLVSLGRARAQEPVEAEGFRAPEDGLSEEVLDSRPVWHGAFLTAEDVTVRLPNGKVAQRDVLRHPGAVAVIALTADGKVVLVHQYRTALEQVTLEIPAGKLDPGEDPQVAAARELVEETGYTAARMAYLGSIAMAPGYSDEVVHLYMAMGLSFVGACPDEDEFVHVDLVDLDDMVDQVLDGKIVDSKTVVGVLLCDAISRRMEA